MLGAGGMVVVDDRLPIIEAVEHLSAYNARESCGKCTPCREGMAHMTRLIGAVRRGTADATARAQLDALPEVITAASLCGPNLGQAAPDDALPQPPPVYDCILPVPHAGASGRTFCSSRERTCPTSASNRTHHHARARASLC